MAEMLRNAALQCKKLIALVWLYRNSPQESKPESVSSWPGRAFLDPTTERYVRSSTSFQMKLGGKEISAEDFPADFHGLCGKAYIKHRVYAR